MKSKTYETFVLNLGRKTFGKLEKTQHGGGIGSFDFLSWKISNQQWNKSERCGICESVVKPPIIQNDTKTIYSNTMFIHT